MTTIAWDGKTLAADSLTVRGETITDYDLRKIFKVGESQYFAAAGSWSDIVQVVAWLRGGRSDDEKPKKCSMTGLLVTGESLYEVCSDCTIIELRRDEPIAFGSGMDHALSAMDVGATAKQAIKCAIKRDPYSGGEVRTKKL